MPGQQVLAAPRRVNDGPELTEAYALVSPESSPRWRGWSRREVVIAERRLVVPALGASFEWAVVDLALGADPGTARRTRVRGELVLRNSTRVR